MTLSRNLVPIETVSLKSSIIKLPDWSTKRSRLIAPRLQQPPSGRGCYAHGLVETKGLQYSALW